MILPSPFQCKARLVVISEHSESDPRGGLRGLQPPSLGSFQTCLATHVNPFFILKIISSCPIDHYKKTVAVPLLDSLIIKMQDRLSDEDRHARHLLCLAPSIIVNKALQLDDEVEGVLFWEKDIPFVSPLEMR